MKKIIVCDISGMGGRKHGGYEWGCQVIALRTARFLQTQKSESELPRFKEYENIVGVAIPDNAKAREMDDFILAHPVLQEAGMTGAMHQFGMAHGRKLFELGREGYLAELRKDREDSDFYEFNEADAFPEEVTA